MFAIDTSSPVPPFEQLRMQLADQARSGDLAAGTRLPTVRKLAEDLGLAPNTVARAYRELEADGFIETRGRNGSFVSAQGDAAEKQAQEAARAYADRILKLGISRPQALTYVTAALDG
jgi:DNA-binding transcriptional regulator YhcF (GntR family)